MGQIQTVADNSSQNATDLLKEQEQCGSQSVDSVASDETDMYEIHSVFCRENF